MNPCILVKKNDVGFFLCKSNTKLGQTVKLSCVFWFHFIFVLFLLIAELAGLIKFTRPFLALVSKAKAAKLVRGLVDMFLDMEATTGKEVTVEP